MSFSKWIRATSCQIALYIVSFVNFNAIADNHVVVDMNGNYQVNISNPELLVHGDRIPVRWMMPHGERSATKHYKGLPKNPSGLHQGTIPLFLERNADGTWEVTEGTWNVIHGPREYWETTIESSRHVYFQDPSTLHLTRERLKREVEARGGMNMFYTHDTTFLPSTLDEADVNRAMSAVLLAYNTILADGFSPAEIHFVWDASLTGLAGAVANWSIQPRASVINGIGNLYTSNDMNSYETALQENTPVRMNYYSRLFNNNATEDVAITLIQRSTILLIGLPEMVVKINPNAMWDTDPSDGISPGRFDLTGALMHEIGHHLGFSSATDLPTFGPLPEYILSVDGPTTFWDTFRLNADDTSISLPEFRSRYRELRPTEPAVSVLGISQPSQVFRMSRGSSPGGDGYGASHWLDESLNGGLYIGLMDPFVLPGVDMSKLAVDFFSLMLTNTYFSFADIKSFDVLGYNIDISDYSPFPIIMLPFAQAPISDTIVDPYTNLTFLWDPEGAEESDILVYDLGTTVATSTRGAPPLVFRENGISGGALMVNSSEFTMLPGHRYEWRIAARHTLGFARSEPSTFIAACYADRTGDGFINFFDLNDFLADFNAMNPSADLAEPFGVWNFFDQLAYQTLFNAGCP